MRNFLLVLLLTAPALALPSPEELITKIYRTHLKTHDARQTVSKFPRAFSPEFLELINQAPLDTDIFTHTQATLTDFAVESSTLWTNRAEVHVRFWTGDRLGQQKSPPQDVTVYLSDAEEGAGFQIQDIQFPGRPAFKVYDHLLKLNGQPARTP
ncbi:hypothetical protein JST97_38085 [bacterium]|nr:hypothetical protein [bacterium]